MDNLMSQTDLNSQAIRMDIPTGADAETPDNQVMIDDKVNRRLLDYLLPRLRNSSQERSMHLNRYARVDRMISTWQQLSKEDTIRQQREDNTGRQQAIAMNLPIADAHIDDSVSFYTEIYAPAGGNFYSNQGPKDKVTEVMKLAETLNQDTKARKYYSNVSSAFRALHKYNIGGFFLTWDYGDDNAAGNDRLPGNRVEAIDMYNFLYDSSIRDVRKITKEAEWVARVTVKNRLWLLRGVKGGTLQRVDKLLGRLTNDVDTKTNVEFYRNPPNHAGLAEDGSDDGTSEKVATQAINWSSYGLGLTADAKTSIEGYEVVQMFAWVNPVQLGITTDKEDSLELWEFLIVNGTEVVSATLVPNAVELPAYVAYLRSDEMLNANRSMGELMRPFQRFLSFMANIMVAVERGNTYGVKVYDPKMFDADGLKNGETAGVLASKAPGRDVRSGIMRLDTHSDTSSMMQTMGTIIDLMRTFFPTQSLPGQVAGIDRAVSSQVAAVMQGALKRMQKSVRELDDQLMNPLRVGSYRNYIQHDSEKMYEGLTETDVATLLNSGLGQLNREAAGVHIRELLFALIQNPESSAQFDIPGLFTLWSQMLNTGTDLGKLVSQQAQAGQQGAMPVDPNQPPAEGGMPPQ